MGPWCVHTLSVQSWDLGQLGASAQLFVAGAPWYATGAVRSVLRVCRARPWMCSNGKSVTCRPALVSVQAWGCTPLHLCWLVQWVKEAPVTCKRPSYCICAFPRVPTWAGDQYLRHSVPGPLLPPVAWHRLCAGTLPAWLWLPWRTGESDHCVLVSGGGTERQPGSHGVASKSNSTYLPQLLHNGTCIPPAACPCTQLSLPWHLTLPLEEQARELPPGTVLTWNCTQW